MFDSTDPRLTTWALGDDGRLEELLARRPDEERLRGHLERGALLLNGEPVTDLDAPAPPGTWINFGGQ